MFAFSASSPSASRPAPRLPAVPAALAFTALLVLAAVIRVLLARESHLWFDELDTLFVARRPLPELLRAVAADIHPPLHFLLVAAWRAIGGEGDLWIKSLSILTGVLGVALLVPAGRDFFSRGTGWLAAVLLALHPAHAMFSQESRSFVLLFGLLSLATWAAWRWLERGRNADAVLYVLAASAALWTHYQAGVVLAFTGAWGLFALRRTPGRMGTWLGLHAAVALLFAPQLPTLLVQLQRLRADHWVKDATASTLVNFLRQLSMGPVYMMPVLLLLAVVPLLRSGTRRAASLLWCTSLLPVFVLWALSMAHVGLFLERYMFFALPPFVLLVSAGALAGPGRWGTRVLVALLLVSGVRGLLAHQRQPDATALEQAERRLAPRIEPGDLVVHADAHGLLYARHYPADRAEHVILVTTPALPYYEGEEVIDHAWRLTPEQFAAMVAGGRRWWGVHEVYGYPGAEPGADLLRRAARGDSLHFGRMTLWAGTPAQTVR